jgi:hypothetical protein
VLLLARADALGHDRRARTLAVVDHLGAGIGLLVIVGHRDRIKFADAVFAVEHAAEGYFHVTALPVSTCVQLTLLLRALAQARAW